MNKPQVIKSTIQTKASKILEEELEEDDDSEELSVEQLKAKGLLNEKSGKRRRTTN